MFYQSGLRVFEISPQFQVIGRQQPGWRSRGGVRGELCRLEGPLWPEQPTGQGNTKIMRFYVLWFFLFVNSIFPTAVSLSTELLHVSNQAENSTAGSELMVLNLQLLDFLFWSFTEKWHRFNQECFQNKCIGRIAVCRLTPGLPEKRERFGFPPWDFVFETSQHAPQLSVVYSPENLRHNLKTVCVSLSLWEQSKQMAC